MVNNTPQEPRVVPFETRKVDAVGEPQREPGREPDDGDPVRCSCDWLHPVDGNIDANWPATLDPECPVHSAATSPRQPSVDAGGERERIKALVAEIRAVYDAAYTAGGFAAQDSPLAPKAEAKAQTALFELLGGIDGRVVVALRRPTVEPSEVEAGVQDEFVGQVETRASASANLLADAVGDEAERLRVDLLKHLSELSALARRPTVEPVAAMGEKDAVGRTVFEGYGTIDVRYCYDCHLLFPAWGITSNLLCPSCQNARRFSSVEPVAGEPECVDDSARQLLALSLKIAGQSQEMDPDFRRILYENLWDLYYESSPTPSSAVPSPAEPERPKHASEVFAEVWRDNAIEAIRQLHRVAARETNARRGPSPAEPEPKMDPDAGGFLGDWACTTGPAEPTEAEWAEARALHADLLREDDPVTPMTDSRGPDGNPVPPGWTGAAEPEHGGPPMTMREIMDAEDPPAAAPAVEDEPDQECQQTWHWNMGPSGSHCPSCGGIWKIPGKAEAPRPTNSAPTGSPVVGGAAVEDEDVQGLVKLATKWAATWGIAVGQKVDATAEDRALSDVDRRLDAALARLLADRDRARADYQTLLEAAMTDAQRARAAEARADELERLYSGAMAAGVESEGRVADLEKALANAPEYDAEEEPQHIDKREWEDVHGRGPTQQEPEDG